MLELNLEPRRGLAAADDATLLKFGVKQVAASLGMRASFLAKTAPGEEGSSGHVHMSLWAGETNAFAGPGPAAPAPQVLGWAIAGVLDHLPAASLLLNPTINSYKRLVPGWFAPINATWGYENRSCAVRAIRSDPPGSLAVRVPSSRRRRESVPRARRDRGGAADGIRRELAPPAPIEGDAYALSDLPELPASLESAIQAFEGDLAFRQTLSEPFSEYYATSRAWELKAWRETVTDWERDRYERAV